MYKKYVNMSLKIHKYVLLISIYVLTIHKYVFLISIYVLKGLTGEI